MNEKISSDELIYISKFTATELDKAIKSLELLIKQKGFVDPSLNRDIVNNTGEIMLYLPNVKHLYLRESIAPLKRICLLITYFVKTYPEHQFNNIFLQVVDVISQYFNRFAISEDLSSNTPHESNEDRTLAQRVINPNYDNDKDYNHMIKSMVKSSGPHCLSDDNWKALADGVLATYEGAVDANPTMDTLNDLLIASANRLHQREQELKASKTKIAEQLSQLPLTSEQKKEKRQRLTENAANGIIISNTD